MFDKASAEWGCRGRQKLRTGMLISPRLCRREVQHKEYSEALLAAFSKRFDYVARDGWGVFTFSYLHKNENAGTYLG